jgi:hypothetical protein
MQDIIRVLATQGWEKIIEEHDQLSGVDGLVERFKIPLQGVQADCDKIKEEVWSIMEYAVHFISLATLDHRGV